MESDHQQLEQADFPAFPVVFQQELQTQFDNSQTNQLVSNQYSQLHVPEQQLKSILNLIQVVHDKRYINLFTQSIQDKTYMVENFFNQYQALDQKFISEMKAIIKQLHIVRMGQHKIYVGQLKDDTCNGKGILVFKNGNIYEGGFQLNKRTGKGFFIQNNIGWYKGNFAKDLKNGEGIQVFYKKSVYRGHFYDGLRHQKGLYADKDGNIYNGGWKLGIMHGKGTLKTNQSTYSGMFVNWLKHGSGQQKFTNGDTYIGEYQNGRFDGNGVYNWKNAIHTAKVSGSATYEGNFRNGLRHGKGKWSSGSTKYNGTYSEGLKQGYGELYFPSGNFYKGNFIQDKRQGYGEMFWTDGSFYKGEWKNGIQNGKGQIYMSQNQIISGIFENSILVQILPSIYQKQMEITNLSIHDLFGTKQKIQLSNRQRVFSQTKSIQPKKKLSKIDETTTKKNNNYHQTHNSNSYNRNYNHNNHNNHNHNHNHHNHHNHSHNNHSANNTGILKSKLYFKSPQHSHSNGKQCKCVRRLQNFRLRNRKTTKLNESTVNGLSQN